MLFDQISQHESNVRGYVRLFPTVFDVARGSELWDQEGRRYIDFFCGAGTLNYGHNNPKANAALVEYIQRDGIQHALDTATVAKARFVEKFQEIVLKPRHLEYKLQFTGPTGTNAVEAAVKLARRMTERSHVIAFTRAYHGHSLGALALTGNQYYHSEFYGAHQNVTHFPFDGYCPDLDSADLLRQMLMDQSSGIPLPAAVILETVQGEGGVNIASSQWLRKIEALCRELNIVLIVDDIQVGNGRTGRFFSFEEAGLKPDMVCLSKSLGGGLPMSLVLIRPEWDGWEPGQHTGTFRGNNLAFVAAAELLGYWQDNALVDRIARLRQPIEEKLQQLVEKYSAHGVSTRGRGFLHGLDVRQGVTARRIIDECFSRGLLIEASGAHDQVLKLMPALTIPEELLLDGLSILERAVANTFENNAAPAVVVPPLVAQQSTAEM